ncbi:hypothetical protein D8674_002461 [Pyrus ussuriensis x Pyrus communis]|uniref:Uncharacterized protein n=1 Tax=Pyrus ussuriensis x Pyrus communis TaxID=2448454 RepID=A0A5N5FEC8_9ROSA|nr:hypothetical protein D8674_002461 [Pyrus ussuriensis x Pyrus communis]
MASSLKAANGLALAGAFVGKLLYANYGIDPLQHSSKHLGDIRVPNQLVFLAWEPPEMEWQNMNVDGPRRMASGRIRAGKVI